MQNIALDVENNAQKILPVPYTKPPTPSVESPVNYGSSPYPVPLKQSSRKNDDLQYCNFLEPSPRDQRLNVPYEGQKDCPKFKTQPYGKDSCYLLDSKAQGVVGIVCNEAGGSDNANFYRGNQFGVDFPFDFKERINQKKLEYTVEQPAQIPMQLQNPMMVYDKGTFYPEPSFKLRKDKDFITYPLENNFTENGLPTYTYPYKTLNPIVQDTTQNSDITENFTNYSNSEKKLFFMLILLLIIILFVYFINR
jgi:hypothetical protein